MWTWIIVGLVVIYVAVGFVTFYFHMRLNGLISPGLALFRALVWPIFWTTGWPSGQRLPMD